MGGIWGGGLASGGGSGVGTGVSTLPYSEVPSGTVNGSNKVFTLTYTPVNPAGIQVVLNGGIQKNGVDYTMSGNTINFVTAPANGSIVYAFYNDQISTSTFNMPYDETPGGLINGSNTAYTLTYTPASATSLQVVLNGNVLLPTTDYTLSGAAITTTFAPAANSQIYAFYNVVGVYTTYAEVPSGTVNGSNVTFTLTHAPNPAITLQVCLDGRVQTYGTDYTLSGSTITFVAAPATSSLPYAFYSTMSASPGPYLPFSGTGLIISKEVSLIGTISDQTIPLQTYAPYGYTVNEVYQIYSTSGTTTAAFKIGSTAITGLGSISVTSTPQDVAASAANVVAAGNALNLVLSSSAALTNLFFTIKATRN